MGGLWGVLLFASQALALTENKPIHFSADKQVWDRKTNRVELFGHAAVVQAGETLTADYILLNQTTRNLDAIGNCVYITPETLIWGEEMHFNLDTRVGTILGGRVSNDQFTLRGEKIDKLDAGRFFTHWGEYSTCRDCAASWSLLAEDVDMEVEGYAFLKNVTAQVKDAPALWLPYLVVPMKTKRQTGLLFPTFSFSGSNGATFVQPFFWAINRSSDMTLGLGQYTARGNRLEWEGRYALTPRSGAKANFFLIQDKTFRDRANRWTMDIAQTQELPFGIEEKLRFTEVSDNLYPFFFAQDIPGAGDAFLPSRLILSRGSPNFSAYVAFQRYRNLLNSTPGDLARQETEFDPRTVQTYPTAVVTTNDKQLFGSPFFGGFTVGLTNFTRTGGAFDYDDSSVPFGTSPPVVPPAFRPGIDPIRQATRLSVTPSLYTTFRPFDVLSVVPSLQYRAYFYNFSNLVPNLYRGYLLFQTDLSTELEKIYEFPDDPNIPRGKHLIRPLLTYSYIPYIREDPNHPFLKQIKNGQANGIYGYNFDDYDIVPVTFSQNNANYFVPLGHSLAYGATTQWIRRRGGLDLETPTYKSVFELSAGQALNFLEITQPLDPNRPRILTRFFSNLLFDYDHFQSRTLYYYYPEVNKTSRHTVTTSSSYIFERSMHQRVLTYDRSATLSYVYDQVSTAVSNNLIASLNFSISDYLLPTGSISYGLKTQDRPSGLLGASMGLMLQSPSRCWRLATNVSKIAGIQGLSWNFDLSLNLTGAGFGGVSEMVNQASTINR